MIGKAGFRTAELASEEHKIQGGRRSMQDMSNVPDRKQQKVWSLKPSWMPSRLKAVSLGSALTSFPFSTAARWTMAGSLTWVWMQNGQEGFSEFFSISFCRTQYRNPSKMVCFCSLNTCPNPKCFNSKWCVKISWELQISFELFVPVHEVYRLVHLL